MQKIHIHLEIGTEITQNKLRNKWRSIKKQRDIQNANKQQPEKDQRILSKSYQIHKTQQINRNTQIILHKSHWIKLTKREEKTIQSMFHWQWMLFGCCSSLYTLIHSEKMKKIYIHRVSNRKGKQKYKLSLYFTCFSSLIIIIRASLNIPTLILHY